MASELTWSKALKGYFLAARARRLSRNTLKNYSWAFRKFSEWLGEDRVLETITVTEVREFLDGLRGLKPKSVANIHVALSALWTWAVEERVVRVHIIRRVQAPKPDQRRVLPYSMEDVRGMLGACDEARPYKRPGKRKCANRRPTALRDKAVILLLVDTGIRASELCDLRIYHCDLRNERLKVMGKGRRERLLPISARTGKAIWRYLATREDGERAAAPLFVTRTGRPLDRYQLRRMLMRAGRRAGVQGANVHRFRHTFALEFLRNGGNAYALQQMLGHSTLEMVRRYLAIAEADVERVHRDASPVANWVL